MTKKLINEDKINELRELDDSNEVLKELIELFITTTTTKMQKMEELLASKDHPALRKEAHSLRSSSANLGAEILSQLATEMEYLKEEEKFGELFAKIKSQFMEVKEALLKL